MTGQTLINTIETALKEQGIPPTDNQIVLALQRIDTIPQTSHKVSEVLRKALNHGETRATCSGK